ncbi:hypothetical protein AOC36_08680 [Erysipelothrix larvae]|uniref:protein-tyrosine-phosphatase n=1 Tax=Erysipelothrix larvae TaxID=1514105 RepID=A0A0X8H0X5_9FIRM|nr:CpsB/CapC family capsule biosynthesis tyrosine phosphatase [Erysipelothrix larvae]AMC94060.1 hypothetical protein AOC36_08680 [Erysipelothrix larvae]
MIDIHTHILFGIDDGAKTLEDSLALIDMQLEQGVHTIVLTPHYNPLKQDLDAFIELRDKNCQILKQAILETHRDITILKGAEVLYSSKLFEMNLEDLVIENTDYILIEFSPRTLPSNLMNQISELIGMGYIPIIAHMERYPYFKDNLDLPIDLMKCGVLMQVNASSFIDQSQSSFIHACMRHGWIHCIASDVHSIDKRPSNMIKAKQAIKEKHPKLWNTWMVNVKQVLENEIISVQQPSKIRSFLGKYI